MNKVSRMFQWVSRMFRKEQKPTTTHYSVPFVPRTRTPRKRRRTVHHHFGTFSPVKPFNISRRVK